MYHLAFMKTEDLLGGESMFIRQKSARDTKKLYRGQNVNGLMF